MSYSTDSTAGKGEGILLGLGNPLLDISVKGDESLLTKYDLKANNAIIAEDKHHPLFEDMVKNYAPHYLAGGATQNSIRVAQWMLQFPKATTFMGGIGKDKFGEILKEKDEDVGVNAVFQLHGDVKSGVCGVIITNEDRSLVTELGASQKFDLDFIHDKDVWSYIEKARCYYIGGFFIPNCPQAVVDILQHSSKNGKTAVMNLHATFLCHYFADPKLDLMSHVDVLFGNGDEAQEFSKCQHFQTEDIKQIALKTLNLPKKNPSKPRLVIFTQGRDPTIIATDGKVEEIPVPLIEHELIKDTNGCGDSFVGGFLSQLVLGKSIEECLRCAFYAAKVVIQEEGCNFPPKPDFH